MKSVKILRAVALLLALLTLLTLSVACTGKDGGETEAPETTAPVATGDTTAPALPEIWNGATYKEDKTFGEGAKTVEVEVKAENQSITFTIHTDKETLGAALLEHELISGEQGAFGLYVKFVNGIEADYDKDGTYWGFYKNGEMMMVGVDGAVIADGEHYELVKE